VLSEDLSAEQAAPHQRMNDIPQSDPGSSRRCSEVGSHPAARLKISGTFWTASAQLCIFRPQLAAPSLSF